MVLGEPEMKSQKSLRRIFLENWHTQCQGICKKSPTQKHLTSSLHLPGLCLSIVELFLIGWLNFCSRLYYSSLLEQTLAKSSTLLHLHYVDEITTLHTHSWFFIVVINNPRFEVHESDTMTEISFSGYCFLNVNHRVVDD